MKINIFLLFICASVLFSCKKDINPEKSYYKGQMTILTDESFASVTEALADGYTISYPEAKIKVESKKEDLGFLDLLHNKAKIIVMSRDLTPKEKEEYEKQVDLKFVPAKFAADAVLFVVPSNSTMTSLSIDQIKASLLSDKKEFIFDGANASNINFVAQKLNLLPKDLKFSVIPGNENIIDQLEKYPNKIGVIGLNTISREYDKKSEELSSKIKILTINQNGKDYLPEQKSLADMSYPFTRVLYFLANEGNFDMANGFIRYSCTHIGQKIVQKEGLQPYNLYKREVQMR